MKKVLSLILVTLLPLLAHAYDAQIDGIYYNFSEDEATVTCKVYNNDNSYSDYFGSVVIPKYVNYIGKTYSVTSIGDYAFQYCSGLTSTTIPESVTSIGDYAFRYCSDLTSITIPETMTIIGRSAFSGCSGLTSVTIPNSVTSIGSYAFYSCSGLTSVTIPNSVTSIGDGAFSGCNGLTSVTIPNSVTSIWGSAFSGCYFTTDSFINNSTLTSSNNWGATLYDGEETSDGLIISNNTVVKCRPWATSVTIPNSVTSIGDGAFSGCNGLTSVTIPNSVTSIGRYAFSNCNGLTSITIGSGVTSIGDYAFYKCNGLTSVTIPNIVTSIGNYAFCNCRSLTSIAIPNSVTSINEYAFCNCSSLTSITFPNSVTSINEYAFCNCSSLTSITFSNSVTSIGDYAFYKCNGLTSVTFPNSVTSIGSYAFSGCNGLTSVTIPNSVTSIGGSAFGGTAWYNDQPNGLVYAGKVAYVYKGTMPTGTQIVLKEGTVGIASGAFYQCNGLASITIPNSVTCIGFHAFEDCTSLTTTTIPQSVTSIGERAFFDCSGLTSITIGSSVTSIGGWAFCNCSGLTSFSIPNSVTSIGNRAFSGCYFTTDSFINNSALISSNNWGATLCNETSDGLLIKDNSVVRCRPWATSITIPNSVTSIGNGAFFHCRSLTSIPIPNSVTRIGERAFCDCSGLTFVTIPNNVIRIGNEAFSGCYFTTDSFINNSTLTSSSNWGATLYDGEETSNGLLIKDNSVVKCRPWVTSVTIPNSVTSIGSYAFSGCRGLTSVTISNSVTSIGGWAFSGCSSLTSVTIPSSVTSIGGYAFYECSGLTSITIGSGVTSIGEWAFSHCIGLTSVTIPESVTAIGNYAFYECSGLTSVTIPCSVTSIGNGAFHDCSNLTTVTLESNDVVSGISMAGIFGDQVKTYILGNAITRIGGSAFENCSSLTSINIGRGIKKIGGYAFNNCKSLKKIVIPNNVEEIGIYAFPWLNLSSIIIEDGEKDIEMTEIMSSDESIFIGNTIDTVYLGRNGAVMKYSKIKHLTLGKMKIFKGLGYYNYYYGGIGCDTINVLNIQEASDTLCFSVNRRLNNNFRYYYIMPFNNIHIDSIYCNRIIGIYDQYNISNKHPFDGVVSPLKLELGRELTSINDGIFYGCRISSLYIPNTIKNITSTSFQFCSDLSSVQIEDGPEPLNFSKGDNFYGCPLKSVYLGRNMTFSTNSPFNRNKEGIISLTFGKCVTEIHDRAFSGLKNLTELTLTTSLRRIGEMAFYGCEGLTSLSIPSNVTEIGQQAFDLCRNLKTITLEDSSEELAFTALPNNNNNAFTNSPLKEVYIGRNFNYSNISPFFAIDSLKTLTLSNDVTYLKDRAFAGCCGLKEVYSYAEDTPDITPNTFGGIEVNKVLLIVPDVAFDKYKSHPIWKQFWIESPTDISNLNANHSTNENSYNLSGQVVGKPQKGINIIRYSDGTTKKVLVK